MAGAGKRVKKKERERENCEDGERVEVKRKEGALCDQTEVPSSPA